jgi:hypothetical protein
MGLIAFLLAAFGIAMALDFNLVGMLLVFVAVFVVLPVVMWKWG